MLPSKIAPTTRPCESMTGGAESELRLGGAPALRQRERLSVGGARVQPAEGGKGGDGLTLIGPPLNAAVGQPQREGRIGVDRIAVDLEARARESLLCPRDRAFDL